MATIEDFMGFVESLPDKNIPIPSRPGLRTMNLETFTKDIQRFSDLREWWKSKNMTPHLNKVVAQAILDQNPPEAVRDSLLFLMLW